MNPDYILLGGIKNPQRIEDYFASHLVDIAYAEPIGGDKLKILVERDIDFEKEKDLKWILDLIVAALRENREEKFTLSVKGVPKVKQGAVENRDTLFVYSLI